ncbi:MAG: heme-binding domain-containing protein [Chitinophagaceae bacterium]|nr:heme-binding domain-containing protein [Chitinophagaceae bacterium]
MFKKILIVLLVILVIIQFIRPGRNISAAVSPNDISHKYHVPETVQSILKTSCNDCHSNNTVYPWYANVQPVAWWLQHHVNEGKSELDFSEFLTYSPKKAHHKMEEVIEMVKEGEMPLNSYLWVHKDAKLSADQKKMLTDWADGIMKEIAVANNLKPEEKK